MAVASGSGSGGGSDFSVMVIGSDFAVDAGAALLASPADREEWHDCVPDLVDDFSDLEELQVVRVQGADRSGRSVVRVVGKFFPGAPNLSRYFPSSSHPRIYRVVFGDCWCASRVWRESSDEFLAVSS